MGALGLVLAVMGGMLLIIFWWFWMSWHVA
jgi:hypothetical protein